MSPKVFIALIAAAAVAVGFALPGPQDSEAKASQFELLELEPAN
jgi:hypothetical protein